MFLIKTGHKANGLPKIKPSLKICGDLVKIWLPKS